MCIYKHIHIYYMCVYIPICMYIYIYIQRSCRISLQGDRSMRHL